MGFFKSIPPETAEAALVDGYHSDRAFLRVALPVACPGSISVIVLSFTLTLHEFIYALVFITRSEWRTLSVGVSSELILGDVFFWQLLLAPAPIIAIPVGLLYNLFLERLIQGFTAGAVKRYTVVRPIPWSQFGHPIHSVRTADARRHKMLIHHCLSKLAPGTLYACSKH